MTATEIDCPNHTVRLYGEHLPWPKGYQAWNEKMANPEAAEWAVTAAEAFRKYVVLNYQFKQWTECVDAERGWFRRESSTLLYEVKECQPNRWRIQVIGEAPRKILPVT